MRADHTTRTVTSLATEVIARQDGLPDAVKIPFIRSIGRVKSAEQVMWREVAARMVLDAFGVTPETTSVYEGIDRYRYARYERTVNQARAWFERHATDVETVFDMAGVDLYPIKGALNKLKPMVPPRSINRKTSHDNCQSA